MAWSGAHNRELVAIVDDDESVRNAVHGVLRSIGLKTRTFSSAEEFLQSGTLAGAICLVTDVRMPGMDGIELQRCIRLERPELPVIFISAHHDDEIRQRALDEGAVRFLYKPFDGAELLRAIEAALNDSPEDDPGVPNQFGKE